MLQWHLQKKQIVKVVSVSKASGVQMHLPTPGSEHFDRLSHSATKNCRDKCDRIHFILKQGLRNIIAFQPDIRSGVMCLATTAATAELHKNEIRNCFEGVRSSNAFTDASQRIL